MEQCCGPLAVEFVPGKQENSAISAPILPRGRELSLAHAQRGNFLITEQCYGPLAVEMFPVNHYDFSTNLAQRARTKYGSCADVQFHDYGTVLWSLAVEMVPGKQEITAISAPILSREREHSLAHAQKCIFLIMEQCYGPFAVELFPRKHCDFSTYLAKRARA
jgi:hypothetical protein